MLFTTSVRIASLEKTSEREFLLFPSLLQSREKNTGLLNPSDQDRGKHLISPQADQQLSSDQNATTSPHSTEPTGPQVVLASLPSDSRLTVASPK